MELSDDCPRLQEISREFKRKVFGATFSSGSKQTTADIKDFFLSGDLRDLVGDICHYFSGDMQILVRDVMTFLLNTEYVIPLSNASMCKEGIEGLDGDTIVYKVVRGSGMGLIHSGHIANLSFFHRVERILCQPHRLRGLGVIHYKRYFDDIWVCFSDRTLMTEFYSQVRMLANHFKVTADNVASVGIAVKYLDLATVLRDLRDDGVVHVAPELNKPVIPLLTTSGHPWHVHLGWPCALMQRVFDLAGSLEDACHFGDRLICKYESSNASAATLQVMRSSLIRLQTKGYYDAAPHPVRSSHSFRVATIHGETVHWIKLGYHPLWTSVLRKALKRAPCLAEYKLRVGWRNQLPTIGLYVNQHNRKVMAKHPNGRSIA